MMHKFDPGAFERLLREEREHEERPREILKKFGITPGSKVLEVGCGPGFYLPFISETVSDSGLVVGSDIQIEMLKIAKKHISRRNINNIYLTANSEEHLPFVTGAFDFVLLAHTLHELRKPQKLLQEIHRVLKKNGILTLWDWDKNYDGPPGPPQRERLYPEQAIEYLNVSGFTPHLFNRFMPYRYFIKAIKKGDD